MVMAIACLMLVPAMWAAALLFLAVAGDVGSISAKRLLGRLNRRLTEISTFSPRSHDRLASQGGAVQQLTRIQELMLGACSANRTAAHVNTGNVDPDQEQVQCERTSFHHSRRTRHARGARRRDIVIVHAAAR